MSNFLEARHPEWEDKKARWKFTWDNYTGEYAKHDRVKLATHNRKKSIETLDEYLHHKVQAETIEAYMERIVTSDPVTIFATAVDSLNGIAYAGEESAERDFGDLGDIEEKDSTAYKLWHNADGNGTNWMPLMKQMGIKQTVLHKVWGLVDGIKEISGELENGETYTEVVGEASVHLIDPKSVVNWFPNKNPKQVLVKESTDMRTSIKDVDANTEEDTFILYEIGGWTRYVNREGGPDIIDQGEYEYYADVERTMPCLPIFPVEIPMPRDIGYMLAMKQNHIFNMKSIRDFSVRNMSFAFLQIVANKDQYDDIMADISKGFRVLRKDPDASGEHGYKSPPSDYLTEAGQILDKNKEAFAESSFNSYGDAAKQVTATEIRQESRSGVEAFLSLLVTSLDEFENHCLFLLEQIYFAGEPSRWGKAYVKRSQDFTPKDIENAMEKATNAVRNARQVNAMSIKTAIETINPEWTDDQVKDELEAINGERGALEVPRNMVGA